MYLGAFQTNRLYVPPVIAAAPAPAGFTPAALSPFSWVDMAQQMGVDGVDQLMLRDNASTRTYTRSRAITSPYRTNRKNGLPTMENGGSDWAPSSPLELGTSPFLMWFVMKTSGVDKYFYGSNLSVNQQVRFNFGAGKRMYLFSEVEIQSTALTSAEVTDWAIYTIHRNAANQIRFYYNGVPKFSTPSTLTGPFSLAYYLGEFSAGIVAEFGESGILLSDPTVAQQNQLGQYLRDKWAIAWTNIA